MLRLVINTFIKLRFIGDEVGRCCGLCEHIQHWLLVLEQKLAYRLLSLFVRFKQQTILQASNFS